MNDHMKIVHLFKGLNRQFRREEDPRVIHVVSIKCHIFNLFDHEIPRASRLGWQP